MTRYCILLCSQKVKGSSLVCYI